MGWDDIYLAVSVHHRAEQLPGAAAAVHADHPEDLEEAEAAQGRGGEHLAGAADDEHDGRGTDDDDVDDAKGRPDEAQPAQPALVARPAAGRPGAHEELQGEPVHHDDFLRGVCMAFGEGGRPEVAATSGLGFQFIKIR